MAAHTPLLRALQRLYLEMRACQARGLPVEALPELRAAARQTVTRRAFVTGLGAGALALGLPRRARAGAGEVDPPSVAVVGAGIAGLACALELADHGVTATVYEASGRIGGRMFSNLGYFDEGQVSEWCGELIDTDNLTLQRLAARFGLALDDLHAGAPRGSEDTFFFDGAYYPQAQADADFHAVAEAVAADLVAAGPGATCDASTPAARALDAMSVHDWITSRVPGGHGAPMGKLLDVAYTTEFGADSREQSALSMVYLLGSARAPRGRPRLFFGASDERYHLRGGNQQLPEAVARALGDAVRPGYRLLRIRRTPAGRQALDFALDASVVEVVADVVVLAIPFAVLRALDWAEAGFDALKARAIRELGRGHSGKTQLQLTERLWNRAGPWPGVSNGSSYVDAGYQTSWDVTRAQPGRSGILVFYSGGPVTDAMVATQAFGTSASPGVLADARATLARAERVFPGLSAAWNGKATQSLPHKSDLRGASYAYYRVGQYTAFGGHERARQGGVYFCGEHTSQAYQGHMEGAASEGVRAARQILVDVKEAGK